MEQKDIDIYEILKGMPDGTPLYTPMCGNLPTKPSTCESAYMRNCEKQQRANIARSKRLAPYGRRKQRGSQTSSLSTRCWLGAERNPFGFQRSLFVIVERSFRVDTPP